MSPKIQEFLENSQRSLDELNILSSPLNLEVAAYFTSIDHPSWIRTVADGEAADDIVISRSYRDFFFDEDTKLVTKASELWKDSNFTVLDNKLLRTGESVYGIEHGETADGLKVSGVAHKWPIRNLKGDVVAIAGYATKHTWAKDSWLHRLFCHLQLFLIRRGLKYASNNS